MRPFVIFGGAGFIGTNLAHRVATSGQPVRVVDNFSRATSALNASWLHETHPRTVELRTGDVRDPHTVKEAVADASAVVHFAAQPAVTTSLGDPRHDYEVNLGGTFNVLEALRGKGVPLVFASTSKVYGALRTVPLVESHRRWEPSSPLVRRRGVAETAPLEFASPYGCSKGAADQYVLDHADCFGMPNVVFRMSCIFGPHQFGTRDQGWVSHFLIAALAGEPITIFGDGKQVRDVLFVDDVVDAYLAAVAHADRLGGRAFNLGGSPRHTLSLLELVEALETLIDRRVDLRFEPARHGDRRFYVSDTTAFEEATGWVPRTSAIDGVRQLADWLSLNHPRLAHTRRAAWPNESQPRWAPSSSRGPDGPPGTR
jgi:CDP-paratose 2-epimerase